MPPSRDTFLHVVRGVAKMQMSRICTSAVVAIVQYQHPFRDRPDKPLVRKPMRPDLLSFTSDRKDAVPLGVNPARPLPTSGKWIYLIAGVEASIQVAHDPDVLQDAFLLQLLVVRIAIALRPGPAGAAFVLARFLRAMWLGLSRL